MNLKWIEYLVRNRAGLIKILIVYFLALVIYDVVLPREHAHYWVDKFYAFWTIFGVIGCFILAKVAKGVAHLFLSKDEDYYE
jgi:hypothetical protein